MAGFKISNFHGALPKQDPTKLPEGAAQTASNCKLGDKRLGPLAARLFNWTPTKAGTIQSLYLFSSTYWFHWTQDVDCVPGPVPGDTTERTYYTGTDQPRYTYAGIATSGGGTDYPNNSYWLGLPAPTTPSAAINGTADDENELPETRYYTITYVTPLGEEGPPSDPAGPVTWRTGQTVDVTSIPGAPAGSYNMGTGAKVRIYRINSGTDTDYQYVGEVDIGTTSYNDSIAPESLGEVLASTDYDAPPDDMKGLINMPNGWMAGFSGNQLCVCVPRKPHAWPSLWRKTTAWPIVGIAAAGSSILVTTTGLPYIFSGVDPEALSEDKLEINQSCVSKRGMVDFGSVVAYPSPDGLMLASPGQVVSATEELLTKEQWEAYNPSSIHGYHYDGKYIGFYSGGDNGSGGFILDFRQGTLGWVDLDFYASGGFNDLESDTLYLVVSGAIVAFDSASTSETYLWKSGVMRTHRPTNPSVARVDAESYPVTFKLYADNELKHTETVSTNDEFPLPDGYLARDFAVQMEGTAEVSGISVGEGVDDL